MNSYCHLLHELFNGQRKFSFPFDSKEISSNGIYILFEKGEVAHSANRIVRVGSHTGMDKLPKRLNEHFLKEHKDRSIFRKNIGRAILNKNHDPFLRYWEMDLTSRSARQQYAELIDREKYLKVEKEVTSYIQANFWFIVFPVEDKQQRLYLESRIISTVSLCNECHQSDGWLGNYSPKEKIRRSGLWQENELWKTPLKEWEMKELEMLLMQ